LFFHAQPYCSMWGGPELSVSQMAARNKGWVIIFSVLISLTLLAIALLVWKSCRNRKAKNQDELAQKLTVIEEENEEKDRPVNFMYEEKGQKGG